MSSPISKKYDFMSKLVIVGDASVGKTNILLRFTEDNFRLGHTSTIGVDFKVKTLQVEDRKIKFTLWDTAGQDRFRTMTSNYYKGADGIVFAYSVADRNSFNNVENWVQNVEQHTIKQSCKIIIANKCDVFSRQRQVSTEQGKRLAQKLGIPFMEVSAKENINIDQVFQLIGKSIKQKVQKQSGKPMVSISINKDKVKLLRKKNCC